MANEPKYPVLTLSKALDIIEVLSKDASNRGLGISELSSILGIGKSTVHRLLTTLQYYGYIDKNEETNRYRLGWGLYTKGQILPRQNQLFYLDNKIIIDLNKACGETVNVGVLSNKDVVIVYKVDNVKDSLYVSLRSGDSEALHATALGKTLICEKNPAEILHLLNQPLEKLTKNTIIAMPDLMKELDMVKKQGYSVDNEEFCEGLYCIGMPIRDYSGEIVAAVSVSAPKVRMNDEKEELIIKNLQIASYKISAFLGAKMQI